MKRQLSEGHQSISTRTPVEHPRDIESGKTFSYRSNDIEKVSALRKANPTVKVPSRNVPVKIYNKEGVLSQSYIQKSDSGNPRESAIQNIKSPKHMRVVASLLNMADAQYLDDSMNKSSSATLKSQSKGDYRKKDVTPVKRNETQRRSSNKTPNSYTPLRAEKNVTEISDAIFERDEADEDDHKELHQPRQNSIVSEKKSSLASQPVLPHQEYFPQELVVSRATSNSPKEGLLRENSNYGGVYRFSESQIELSLAAMNKSNETSSPIRPATNVRGAFMNEHISQTELEKQKEKQRKMREALDSQLNEKKQKQQAEKSKQSEFDKREEMRIRREMEQLKSRHDKETVVESKKKYSFKTEESEVINEVKTMSKPNSASQIDKLNKIRIEADPVDVNLDQQREEQRLLKSPVRVQRKLESRSKDPFEPRSHASPVRVSSNVTTLADENRKLRDENTKKEELIDALLMALKNKEVNGQNLQDKTNLHNSQNKENPAPVTSKPHKASSIVETETDFYGYYLNGYIQPKQKYFSGADQVSEINRDLSYSVNEDRNFSLNPFEKIDIKDYKAKVARKADYMMEPLSGLSSHNNSAYYRQPMNGHNLSGLFGLTPNNRGYSSPLAGNLNNLNKSAFTSPTSKVEGKNTPYMPFIASNSNNAPMSLEPIKSVSQGSVGSIKSNITQNNLVLNTNVNSLFRLKKKHEQSGDLADEPREIGLDRKLITSERPAIQIIDESGTIAIPKSNQIQRRDYAELSHPYSSPSYGMHAYKKLDMIDTSTYLEKPAVKALSMSVSPGPLDNSAQMEASETNSQLKLFGKIALYGGNFDKRVSEDLGKGKWAMNDVSPLKKTRKEELFEKVKELPALGSKPKFPKEVFPSNLKKKICH